MQQENAHFLSVEFLKISLRLDSLPLKEGLVFPNSFNKMEESTDDRTNRKYHTKFEHCVDTVIDEVID